MVARGWSNDASGPPVNLTVPSPICPVPRSDETLDEVMTAPLAVVVISDERSSQAARYLAELHAARKRGEFGDVSLAIFNRATGAERRFARAQPWVRNLWVLPYTVIYACGNKADEFASIRAETLVQRLANLRQGTPRSLATPLDRSRMDWRSALIGMRDRAD